MAIAKVRIAPVERWCEPALNTCNELVVGMFVRIITNEMRKSAHRCGGDAWPLHPEDTNMWRALIGQAPTDTKRWLCEHMLEMD